MADAIPQPDKHGSPHIGIGAIGPEIVAAFRAEPHDLAALFAKIKERSPALAGFLLGRAEQLAPRDPGAKRSVTQLALEVLGIVASSEEASDLETQFGRDV